MSHILQNTLISNTEKTAQKRELQPLSLLQSSLLFAVPALIVTLSFYVWVPFLERSGYSPLIGFMAGMILPMSLLMAFAIAAYVYEVRNGYTTESFSERTWFPRPRLRDFGLGFLIVLVGIIGSVVMAPITDWIINSRFMPESLPLLLDPKTQPNLEMMTIAAGGTIKGQWGLLVLTVLAFAFNIIGEELWWRGIILPRQQLAHGRWTWLVHGLQWCLFHISKWWAIPSLIPLSLAMSYTSHRLKNNWPTTIAHTLANFLLYGLVISAVLGS